MSFMLSHSVQMCERYFEIYAATGNVREASIESLISLFPPGDTRAQPIFMGYMQRTYAAKKCFVLAS